MTVTLYRIPQLRADKPNTISFSNTTDRTRFFNNITQKLQISDGDTTIGRVTDLGKLYQEITVFTNGRSPYSMYNYASIHNAGKYYYYFITNYKEIGNTQVVYSLKKDTLITYTTLISGADVNISQYNALVTREHKPRFNFDTERALYHDIAEPNDNTTPKVINSAVYTGSRGVRLVYKNRTDSKPVAYPYVESALSVNVQGSDWIGTITSCTPGSTETMYVWDGSFYYTFGQGNPTTLMTIPSTQYVKYTRAWTPLGEYRVLETFLKTTGEEVSDNILSVPSGVDLKIKVSTTNIQTLRTKRGYIEVNTPWSTIVNAYPAINFSPTSFKALPLWSAIDQYDAMTDRIIELPFFNIAGDPFYEDGYGIFINLDSETSYSISALPIRRRPTGDFDMTKANKNHVVGNDPKLYTSQFAPIIYNFNGASIGFKREQLSKVNGLSLETPNPIVVKIPTLTPSTFSMNITPSASYELEDIDELRVTWDVNNEIASIKDEAYTYNQYYKDLDDKQRRIQESAAFRNTALNAVNQGLGVVGGMIAGGTPNPVQLAARAGQATINIAQSFMDLQDQFKMNEIAAKQKYIGLLLTSTQISGASLDFLKSFNGDKIRLLNFGLTGHEFNYWDQVFHKFGYTTLEYKKPAIKTRRHWDYKQMIVDDVASPIVTDECVLDIRARFAEGVTIFHLRSTGELVDFIDWGQGNENWEE